MSVNPSDRWQLPDGVNELLPDAAWAVEQLRRRVVDRCHATGYDLVQPPMIEYLDSLLTGTGETMNLQTFKMVDQHNGRTLGVRADMTPQVARMDAHALRTEKPNRLFYTGTVVRALTDGFGGNRSPHQFGAELFGHAGAESDIEILRLMLDVLGEGGAVANELTVDLGHVGVYRGIVEQLALDEHDEARVFTAVQHGSLPDLESISASIGERIGDQSNAGLLALCNLMGLHGDVSILDRAAAELGESGIGAQQALQTLRTVVDALDSTHPGINWHIDLSELRGYRYHTGLLFAAYNKNGNELARGGRYDDVGAAFGHPRPATGFSGDFQLLVKHQLEGAQSHTAKLRDDTTGVFVAHENIEAAWQHIVRLRASGERVVTELHNACQTAKSTRCDRVLQYRDQQWVLDDAG